MVSRTNDPVPSINKWQENTKKEAELLQTPRNLQDIPANQGNGGNDWAFEEIKELVIFGRCEDGIMLNAVIFGVGPGAINRTLMEKLIKST